MRLEKMDIVEKMKELYARPAQKEFDYEIGQTVRIIKSIETDTYYIQDLLGQKGKIVNRYVTSLYKENKYDVQFDKGRIEPFDESELDARYKKRKRT